jgi:hypothetical protein
VATLLASGGGAVHASYHQFWITDQGRSAQVPGWPLNGLVLVAGPGVAVVQTGIHTGPVAVAVEVYDSTPGDVAGEWDEVVEVSLTAPAGEVRVASISVHNRDSLPVLTGLGPGDYRMRVHARGRDTLIDGVPQDGPVEDYLIVTWPAAGAPEIVHRQSDGYGASVRQAAARQPASLAPAADPLQALINDKLRRARG